jgi:hypothetical protein
VRGTQEREDVEYAEFLDGLELGTGATEIEDTTK